MKISREKVKFRPVTITLESQEEVWALANAVRYTLRNDERLDGHRRVVLADIAENMV